MADKTIKINFQDGNMKIYKNILEHVSGLYYFFMVQLEEGIKVALFVDRDDIINVETKYKEYWKPVSLKKRY